MITNVLSHSPHSIFNPKHIALIFQYYIRLGKVNLSNQKLLQNMLISLLKTKIDMLNIDQIIWRANLNTAQINKLLATADEDFKRSPLARFIIATNNWQLSQLSKNNRSRYQRSIKQLENINAHFCWVSPEDYPAYLLKLAQYHQVRWQAHGCLGAFAEQSFKDFHQTIIQKCFSSKVRMSAIVIDDTPIAINYYFIDNRTLYFYQSGWDTVNYAKFSIGMALHLWSIDNNPREFYDFMMGATNNSYKLKFKTMTYPMNNIDHRVKPWKITLHRLLSKLTKYIGQFK